VRAGASIGANATLLPGIEIGRGAMVGAGAVVTRNVPPGVVVTGNPARIRHRVGEPAPAQTAVPATRTGTARDAEPLTLPGVELREIPVVSDSRGSLSYAQIEDQLPFTPQRYFLLFDVPEGAIRGAHAHRVLEQFIVCVHGACNVILDDGERREEVPLGAPDRGVYVPAMIWTTVVPSSLDTTVLVLTSHRYDDSDYVRDYDEFLALARSIGTR
jgi:dTDP-4-dehydrorhamnose 3,5-epimerase-like enzyme